MLLNALLTDYFPDVVPPDPTTVRCEKERRKALRSRNPVRRATAEDKLAWLIFWNGEVLMSELAHCSRPGCTTKGPHWHNLYSMDEDAE